MAKPIAADKRVIIDTDPGVDDALAILLAAGSPELHVEALTVVAGNCPVEQGTTNALRVLELVGREDIPVAKGMAVPLVRPPHAAANVHGKTGLGGAELPAPICEPVAQHAVDLLIERVMAAPGEITLVAIGPLTNLAIALRLEPDLASAVREVIIMGGAVRAGGNVTPLAEFNVYSDPHAAHIVFHSGMPITLVPIDVTDRVLLTEADVEQLSAIPSPISAFVRDATQPYLRYLAETRDLKGCALHDPLALALAFAPELVELRPLYVDVGIGSGPCLGKTIADFYQLEGEKSNMRVALEVKARDAVGVFLERVGRLCRARLGGERVPGCR
jgi:purine nucleosidase